MLLLALWLVFVTDVDDEARVVWLSFFIFLRPWWWCCPWWLSDDIIVLLMVAIIWLCLRSSSIGSSLSSSSMKGCLGLLLWRTTYLSPMRLFYFLRGDSSKVPDHLRVCYSSYCYVACWVSCCYCGDEDYCSIDVALIVVEALLSLFLPPPLYSKFFFDSGHVSACYLDPAAV